MKSLAALSLAFAALFGTPALAPAQPRREPPKELNGGGFEIFRAVIDLAKLTPMTLREISNPGQYDDMIVVIIGDPRQGFVTDYSPLAVAQRTLNGGGAVLVVHDGRLDLRFGRDGTHTQIDGRKVAVTKPELAYQGRLFDPLVQPVEGNDPVYGLFRGLNRVATQHPSYINLIRFGNDNRRALARFPLGDSVFKERGDEFDAATYPYAVAASPTIGRSGQTEYRLLVMADHAVFQNSLMAPPPTDGQTDNIFLAQRTIEYLQGPNQFRKRCAYYENGALVEDFGTVRRMMATQGGDTPDFNPLAMLLANQPQITDIGNTLVDEIQNRDYAGAIGGPIIENLPPLLIAATFYASWFLLRRVWRVRQPTETLPPPFAGGNVTADRSGGVFERRKRELVRRNNLYEPIRDALRELFATAGAQGGPGVKPPPIECSSEIRKPAKLREAIYDLWRLAYGRPVVVSVRRSQELAPVIERLHREFAAGAWWFSGTRSEVA
jgi:hypothetical protein